MSTRGSSAFNFFQIVASDGQRRETFKKFRLRRLDRCRRDPPEGRGERAGHPRSAKEFRCLRLAEDFKATIHQPAPLAAYYLPMSQQPSTPESRPTFFHCVYDWFFAFDDTASAWNATRCDVQRADSFAVHSPDRREFDGILLVPQGPLT